MKVEMLEDYVMLVFLFVFCVNSSVLLVCVCYVQNSTVLFVFCMSFCLECNGSDLW